MKNGRIAASVPLTPSRLAPFAAGSSSIARAVWEKELLRAPDLRSNRYLRLVERLEHAGPPADGWRWPEELVHERHRGHAPDAIGKTQLDLEIPWTTYLVEGRGRQHDQAARLEHERVLNGQQTLHSGLDLTSSMPRRTRVPAHGSGAALLATHLPPHLIA